MTAPDFSSLAFGVEPLGETEIAQAHTHGEDPADYAILRAEPLPPQVGMTPDGTAVVQLMVPLPSGMFERLTSSRLVLPTQEAFASAVQRALVRVVEARVIVRRSALSQDALDALERQEQSAAPDSADPSLLINVLAPYLED